MKFFVVIGALRSPLPSVVWSLTLLLLYAVSPLFAFDAYAMSSRPGGGGHGHNFSRSTSEAEAAAAAAAAINDADEMLCPTCNGDLEAAKQRRLAEIKHTILEKLKIDRVPNITREELENLPPLNELISGFSFASLVAAGSDEMYSDQPSSFTPGENSYFEKDDYYIRPDEAAIFPDLEITPKYVEVSSWVMPENLFQFKISATLLTRHLDSAEFRFHLSCPIIHELGDFTAVIEKVVRDRYSGYRTKKGGSVHVRGHQCGRDGRWIQIDVKKELDSWFTSQGEDNLGLKLRIYDNRGREVNVRLATQSRHRPFLKLFVTEAGRIRTRRMTSMDCDESTKQIRCCRYPFTVNFQDFGWDWIIEPKKYEANYCSGECPFVFSPHQHVVTQQAQNTAAAAAAAAGRGGSGGGGSGGGITSSNQPQTTAKPRTPCCGPRKLNAISMLYFDDDRNILHGVLPSMVVESCSCL